MITGTYIWTDMIFFFGLSFIILIIQTLNRFSMAMSMVTCACENKDLRDTVHHV
jgi:hypothetical protein